MRLKLAKMIQMTLLSFAAVGNTAGAEVAKTRPVASSLSPAASVVVARWRAEVAAETSRTAIAGKPSIAKELKRRIAIEQVARKILPDRASSRLSDSDWEAVNKTIWDELNKIDAENTIHLKAILPPGGWFRFKRDGEQVARDAWLIVQHSPDRAFQRRVLNVMAPLVAKGEASGSDYALLFDRIAMFEGRRQRYGSQIICKNGRFEPSAVEDAAKLDQMRATVGLEPIANYLRLWSGKSC